MPKRAARSFSAHRDPANRRYYRLALTPDGEAAAERIGTFFSGQHHHLFTELTREELDGLLLGLSGLARVMEEHHQRHHQHHHAHP